jgi:hypothetical protein
MAISETGRRVFSRAIRGLLLMPISYRYIWAGTRHGHLFEVDTVDLSIASVRRHAHKHEVHRIFRR